MKLVQDADKFDNWQAYFIGDIMESMKGLLEEGKVPPAQVRELTERLAFKVACTIDGSSSVEVDGVELNPILTFAPDGEDLIYCGGNSFTHEYVFGISAEIFGERER